MTGYSSSSIRVLEGNSIRDFVQSCTEHFTGRVLDYGCGKQPYRDVVEAAAGEYVPFDRARFPANVSHEDIGPDEPLGREGQWDVILTNQTFQYVSAWRLADLIQDMRHALVSGGVLVATGPTNWPEVETEDLHRLTLAGVGALLRAAGFSVVRLESRGRMELGDGLVMHTGYGVVARA